MTESLRDIADRIVQTATSTSASAHHVLVHRQLIGKLREALRSTPEPQDCPCGAFELDGQMLHAPSCTRVIHDAEAAGLCLVIPVGQTRPVHPRCAQYPDCPCGGPQPDDVPAERTRVCDCDIGMCSKASRAADQYCRIQPPSAHPREGSL